MSSETDEFRALPRPENLDLALFLGPRLGRRLGRRSGPRGAGLATGATDARNDKLIGKLNTGVLVDNERIMLTSTLSSGALAMGADDVPEEWDLGKIPPEEQDSSQSALVKRLEA